MKLLLRIPLTSGVQEAFHRKVIRAQHRGPWGSEACACHVERRESTWNLGAVAASIGGEDSLVESRSQADSSEMARDGSRIITLDDGWTSNIKPKAIDVLEEHLNKVSFPGFTGRRSRVFVFFVWRLFRISKSVTAEARERRVYLSI